MIKPAAKSAAQSSATSYPFPRSNAIEIPTKAATDVMASLRWCQASARREELFASLLLRMTNRKEYSFHRIIIPNISKVQGFGN